MNPLIYANQEIDFALNSLTKFNLITNYAFVGSRCIAGSVTGGTKDTKEMIEFCAKNKVYPDVEIISIEYINEALERLTKSDAKHKIQSFLP